MSAWLLLLITDFIQNRALTKEILMAAASRDHSPQDMQAEDECEDPFLSTMGTI
jgi:hypothetical protein